MPDNAEFAPNALRTLLNGDTPGAASAAGLEAAMEFAPVTILVRSSLSSLFSGMAAVIPLSPIPGMPSPELEAAAEPYSPAPGFNTLGVALAEALASKAGPAGVVTTALAVVGLHAVLRWQTSQAAIVET